MKRARAPTRQETESGRRKTSSRPEDSTCAVQVGADRKKSPPEQSVKRNPFKLRNTSLFHVLFLRVKEKGRKDIWRDGELWRSEKNEIKEEQKTERKKVADK